MKECHDAIKRNRQIGIQPKFELLITKGKPKGSFDLRSLNREILEK